MAREMKDSGVEWIGEIPEDWKIVRIKNCISARDAGVWGNEPNGENDIICLRIADFNYAIFRFKNVDENFLTKRHYDSANIKKLLLQENDIVIEKSGGGEKTPVGRTVVFDKKYRAVYANFCERIRCKEIILPWYMQYIFVIFYLNGYVWNYIKQTTGIQNLDLTSMLSLEKVALPSLSEQQKIVFFLNTKCFEIDNILAKTRTSIEEYKKLKQAIITQAVTKGVRGNRKMKDSGIEWIGEIPKEWYVSKLKYLISSPLQYGASETGVDYNEELPRYIRITDITIDNKLKEDGKLSLEEATAMPYLLFDDDILFSRSGATVGKTFLYKAEYGKAAFAGYLIRASIDENKAVPKFVYYSTLSQNYDIWKNSMVTQATIQNIGADKYSNYIIAMPLLEEQLEIVEYLDNKISEINKIIQKKEQYLTEIENYKKSLIYEYVTGKKEVPEKYQA